VYVFATGVLLEHALGRSNAFVQVAPLLLELGGAIQNVDKAYPHALSRNDRPLLERAVRAEVVAILLDRVAVSNQRRGTVAGKICVLGGSHGASEMLHIGVYLDFGLDPI
jgi:hypothetical protein